MKVYEFNGSRFQFEEGKQPKGAVEVKGRSPKNKAHQGANKTADKAKAAAEAEAAAKAEAEAKAAAEAEAAAKAEADKDAAAKKSK